MFIKENKYNIVKGCNISDKLNKFNNIVFTF